MAESPQDRADIKSAADELTTRLFKMDRDVSGAAYFLPAFEVRSLTATMKQLRSELQSTREKKLPRQPFAFSNPDAIVIVSDPQQQVCAGCLPPLYSHALDAWRRARLYMCDHPRHGMRRLYAPRSARLRAAHFIKSLGVSTSLNAW